MDQTQNELEVSHNVHNLHSDDITEESTTVAGKFFFSFKKIERNIVFEFRNIH